MSVYNSWIVKHDFLPPVFYNSWLVKKYFLKGQNNVDDSYDFYKKEKNTGSLLYIGLISIFLFSVVPTYTVALLGSLFVISIVKTRMTDLSDWKTPLGNLTKYEFSLFTFNIVIVLACVYAIHDEIEFSRSDNEEFSNSCESLKSGDGVVRSEPTSWSSGTFSAAFAAIYNDDKSDKLCVVLDFGGDKTCTNGTFKITYPDPSTPANAIISMS